MWHNGGTTPSEAAYYTSVMHDALTTLGSLQQQLDKLDTHEHVEVRVALETKMNKVLQEHLPRLIQQLWREICLVLTPVASSQGRDCIMRVELWDELVYQCAQLSFFRSIYQFLTAVISGRVLTSACDTPTKDHCIKWLMKEREHIWESAEGRYICEWLRGLVKNTLPAAVDLEENEVVRLHQLAESVALSKDALWEPCSERIQQHSFEFGAHPTFIETNRDAINEEHIRQEYLKFLRAACTDLAEDLLSLVRQKGFSQSPFPTETHVGIETVTSGNEERTGAVDYCNGSGGVGPFAAAALIAGDDRWAFFRIHPNDDPTLTVEEVADQVRAFYEIYNSAKTPLASILAEGYGDDYADLFDSLELHYFIPKVSNVSVEELCIAPDAFDNPPKETSVHVHGEPVVAAGVEGGARGGTCLSM
ncbi:hypothetical protein TraAM80_07125 [Trypanosoma rangeli]|uniref:Uncharacterized protein n=1 Tax=Trypanosoma rangeli TaxID=5698 RepID=A0A422N754_TRYRA|nr:uncharacterized protein TraAM80_07125 [Trypanosoma rangeli]RNF01272.1 hypothetical protein TraAM80_07125 [Trypanosoma rangeli]|eukprot:RNF01272.1 hypothetical protein TraAM80_07125 [Trypanosoma rangeli]